MTKEQFYETLSRYIQRLDFLGKKVVTVGELWKLLEKKGLSRQRIGYWLKENDFVRLGRRKVGKSRVAEYLLSKEALGKIRKKNRKGFKCYHCNWEGYYDLQPDEVLQDGSMVVKIDDKDGWKICYCPKCNRQDYRVYLNTELDVKKLKNRVVFEARRVNTRGELVESGEGYFGRGMLERPDNLKGKW